MFSILAAEAAKSSVGTPTWIIVVCAIIGALSLFILMMVFSRSMGATSALLKEVRGSTGELKRWGEIAQRQTELNNAPILKVTDVSETTTDQGRGMKIEIRNVGFGSAVNVKCTLVDHNDKEYKSPQTEIIGNESALIEPPILIETVKGIRIEYLSQGGSYAHTTQYVLKSGAQSYALHRVR